MAKHWLTMHWPHLKNGTREHGDCGVWLQKGKEAAAEYLKPGDLVFVYETKTGKPRKDGEEYHHGRQGIVALARITHIDLKRGFGLSKELYTDGSQTTWKKVAHTCAIRKRRFCHHDDVCQSLGYSTNYFFRGFGIERSGLNKLTASEFKQISLHFKPLAAKGP